MAATQHDAMAVRQLNVKEIRGSTEVILEPTESFIIRDPQGFEKFKILMGAEGQNAKLYLNGVQVLK